MQVKFVLKEGAKLPQRSTTGSAGYDICSNEDVLIPMGKKVVVSTGVVVASGDNDCYIRIAERSGLSVKYGYKIHAGVIDSDYRGEIKIIITNGNESDLDVKKGDRIGQMIFEKIYTPELIQTYLIDETKRGEAGFGSTGV